MRRTLPNLQQLSFEIMKGSSATNASSKAIVFLHGILGNKKNLRTLAKQFLTLRPNWNAVLLDHRGHGDSIHRKDSSLQSTVAACADDLVETLSSKQLLSELKLTNALTPTILCGHSFGGKVVLSYYNLCGSRGLSAPNDMWILDSLPGTYPSEDDIENGKIEEIQTVHSVLKKIAKIDGAFKSRAEATAAIQAQGLSLSLAQWIASSMTYTADNKAMRFALDIPVIQELFQDFVRLDMWPVVEKLAADTTQPSKLHFVRAERNPLWQQNNNEPLKRFESLSAKGTGDNVQLLLMKGVGHWLHAENPKGVATLIHDLSSN